MIYYTILVNCLKNVRDLLVYQLLIISGSPIRFHSALWD